MNRLKELLSLRDGETSNRDLIIYILIAYIFSLLIKSILYYQIIDNSNYFYNEHIIPIWTPDSALYGFYANQLLHGVVYPYNSEYLPGFLLYWLVNLTGININTILFFIPIFLSSLTIIPLILIAHHYKLTRIGFYSTLFSSFMTSYYYRTHLGYYDTDILNVFFILLAIYFLIKTVDSKKLIYLLLASITLMLFHLWYHSSNSIIISTILTFIIYILLFKREEIYKIFKYNRYYLLFFIIVGVAILYISDISKGYDRVADYLHKDKFIELQSKDNKSIKLVGDLNIVSEARDINFDMLAYRVSGNKTLFILAIFGYIILLIRNRSLFLTIPIVFLTFLSMSAGLRFTIYGVPLFGFTLIYAIEFILKNLLFKISNFLENFLNITSKIIIFTIIIFAIDRVLIYNKKLSPFYFSSTDDIKILSKIRDIKTLNSFIIAPWDYGWPLWYYSGLNTVVDNGKHGEDNFIVSKIILSPNQYFVRNASLFLINRYKKDSQSKILSQFLKEYPLDYLKKLEDKNFKLPKITKDVYILLHKSMFSTYNSIESTSNINILTGKKYPSNLYNRVFLSKEYNSSKTILKTTSQLSIDIKNGMILSKRKGEDANVKLIAIFKDGKMKFKKEFNTRNNIYIIIYNNMVMIMNRKLYNSFLIQALLFNNYNHNLFKEIVRDRNLVIFKVR